MSTPIQPDTTESALEGWKEIAAFLQRDLSTARRWEREEALPVRRHEHNKRASVYAYPSELTAWREGRGAKKTTEEASAQDSNQQQARRWIWAAATATVAIAGFLVFLSSSEPGRLAQAGAAGEGIRTTELCAGCDILGAASSDGRYLSETDWEGSGDIGIRDLQTGEYRRLGDKPNWDGPVGEAESSLFSPDGQRIAYSWLVEHEGEFGRELRVIDAFGDAPQWRTVYSNSEIKSIESSGWSPDDRLLVRVGYRDWTVALGFVDIDTGDLQIIRSLDRNASSPKLSPDGRWIAYDLPANDGADPRDIFLLASDGSQSKKVTTHRANDFVLGFTPDSKAILFASDRMESYGLWRLSLEGGSPEILMRDLGPVWPLGVLTDGSLVYARDLGSQDLYRAELDSASGELLGEPRIVDTLYQGSNTGPWLSPDGSRLAYFASPGASFYTRGAPDKLMIHNLGSSDDFEIDTAGLSLYFFWDLDWSPDGGRLVFPAKNERGRWAYYESDVKTRSTRKLLDTDSPQPIFWMSDGRTLLFPRRDTRDGERVDVLMHFGPEDAQPQEVYLSRTGWMARMAMSPDRDLIAWREERTRVQVMSVEGGEPRTVFEGTGRRDGIRDIAWAPDGEALLLQLAGDASETWIVPLDGGEARKTDLTADRLTQLSPHPAGKTVFYRAGSSDTRIFKTENFLPGSSD